MALMRVGYLASNSGTIPFSATADGKYLMANSGENTGNLAFWYAAARMFDDPITLLPWSSDVSVFRDKIDRVVIPAANHLNPQWDMQVLADLIETLDKEVVVFGLGAQAQHEDERPELRPGTIRYLQALSSHARTIFVRGVYTAEVCESYGVKNVEPVGCPSISINSDPHLGQLIQSRIGRRLGRLYCAGAAFKSENIEIERALFERIRSLPGSTFVIQTPAELIDCIMGLHRGGPEIEKAHAVLAPDLDPTQFAAVFTSATRCYASVQAWLEDAARHHYSISTRIHGGILSLMAGVPTVVIGHDTRIRELCEVMRIPCLKAKQAMEQLFSVEALFEQLNFDGVAFDANRAGLAAIYHAALTKAGFKPSSVLTKLGGRHDAKLVRQDA